MLNRSVAPAHTSSYQIKFPKVKRHTLDSGIPLYILDEGVQPIIKLEIMFPVGGTYYEAKTATSLLALKMLKEGTESFTSSQLSNHLAQYGAFLELNPSFDVSSVSLYCLTKHLGILLPYLAEMIYSPVFPEHELNRIRQIEIQQLKLQNERTNIVASKRFRNLLFGNNHPYGKIISEADLIQQQQDDLRRFHKDHLSTFEIVASGEVSAESIDIINNVFNRTVAHPATHTSNYTDVAANSSSIKEDKAGALQSSIRVGRMTINKTHPDYIPLLITSHVLGGYFGSRLMKNIREDKGFTYGIYSSVVALKHDSYIVIGTDVKKEFVDDTISEIDKELNTLCSFPVAPHELDTVKNHMIGHFQSRLSSAFSLAEKFKNIHIHGLDYSYYDQYLSTVQNITSQDILEMANKYLHPNSQKSVIIG
ncbi:pitrilysin family protein [Fulvivirga kasyanovii]|uniref:Insulinase family protein n=1 Tax=Fulvivirga kasyanovii TaxID=396812 RepID=A0ABW9RLB2_9BACT|nr:pitrilysin family protein [Fulvivirga kasyanovii]MTI23990.1 insulinase family protein [Fulvivirga kasyanovii]